MARSTYIVEIEAPPEEVWRILADFGGISRWSPTIAASRLTSARSSGVGVSRHCDLTPVGAVEERVVTWEEGSRLDIELRGDRRTPMASGQASFQITPTGTGQTRLLFRMDYTPRLGALGAALDVAVVKRLTARGLRGLAAGLKHYAETGRAGAPLAELPLDAVTVS